jgi:hypothetical protein
VSPPLSLVVSIQPARPIVHESISVRVTLKSSAKTLLRVPDFGRAWKVPIFRIARVDDLEDEIELTRQDALQRITGGGVSRPEPALAALDAGKDKRAAFDLLSMAVTLVAGRYRLIVELPLEDGEKVVSPPVELVVDPLDAREARVLPVASGPGDAVHVVWRDPGDHARLLSPERLVTTTELVGPDVRPSVGTPRAEPSGHRWLFSVRDGALVALRADSREVVERVTSAPLDLEAARVVGAPRQGPRVKGESLSGSMGIPVYSMTGRALVLGKRGGQHLLLPVAIDGGAARPLDPIALPGEPETVLSVPLEKSDFVAATFVEGEKHRFLGWSLPVDGGPARELGELIPSTRALAVTAFADREGAAATFAVLREDVDFDPCRFLIDGARVDGGAPQRLDEIVLAIPQPPSAPRLVLDEKLVPYVFERRADGSWVVWVDALPSVHDAIEDEVATDLVFDRDGTPLLLRFTRGRGLMRETLEPEAD